MGESDDLGKRIAVATFGATREQTRKAGEALSAGGCTLLGLILLLGIFAFCVEVKHAVSDESEKAVMSITGGIFVESRREPERAMFLGCVVMFAAGGMVLISIGRELRRQG